MRHWTKCAGLHFQEAISRRRHDSKNFYLLSRTYKFKVVSSAVIRFDKNVCPCFLHKSRLCWQHCKRAPHMWPGKNVKQTEEETFAFIRILVNHRLFHELHSACCAAPSLILDDLYASFLQFFLIDFHWLPFFLPMKNRCPSYFKFANPMVHRHPERAIFSIHFSKLPVNFLIFSAL